MELQDQNWLQKPDVTIPKVIAIVGLWLLLGLWFNASDFAEDLRVKVSRPLLFQLRSDLTDQSPKLNKAIKVLVIDDATVAQLGSPQLSTLQWLEVIQDLVKTKPRAIIIDGLFSIMSVNHGDEKIVAELIEKIHQKKAPAYAGAFVKERKISFREQIDLEKGIYSWDHIVPKEDRAHVFRRMGGKADQYVYGPYPKLRPVFKSVGHIMYLGDGKFDPVIAVKKHTLLPHVSLAVWEDLRVDRKGIFANGAYIPTFRDGKVLIDFSEKGHYLSHMKPLRDYIGRSESIKKFVQKDDIVFIIPAFYTGNADFKMTPFGAQPAALTHLAFLNSIQNREFLRPVEIGEVLILFFCGFSAFIAFFVGPVGTAMTVVLGTVVIFGTAAFCFLFLGLLIPWLVPCFTFIAVLAHVFVERTRVAEKKSQFIKNCLDGVIDSDLVKNYAKNPQNLDFTAREQIVTVMFIDVVGFSLMSERLLPRMAFNNLKEILGEISAIVHSYGGIVNKNLGDGLLCFFGYSLDSSHSSPDHAEKAVECAVTIQRMNLPRTLREYHKGFPVYPLRIGINSSSVFVGNIGSEDRIDFTVVGNGVNYAKRLEQACSNHAILMGVTTKELIDPILKFRKGMSRKFISIKHHDGLVEAWEYDPFYADQSQRALALNAHKESIKLMSEEERWEIDASSVIELRTNVGKGDFLSFNRSGMTISLPIQLIEGTVLRVYIRALKNKALQDELKAIEVDFITLEVLWMIKEPHRFVFGTKYRRMSDEKVEKLFDIFKSFALKKGEKKNVS